MNTKTETAPMTPTQELTPVPGAVALLGENYPLTDPSALHSGDVQMFNYLTHPDTQTTMEPLGTRSGEFETAIDLTAPPLYVDEAGNALIAAAALGPDATTRIWRMADGEVLIDTPAETEAIALIDEAATPAGERKGLTIGRKDDRGKGLWNLPESVSRKHAKVTRDGSRVFLSDLGSTNGTYVYKRSAETVSEQRADESPTQEPIDVAEADPETSAVTAVDSTNEQNTEELVPISAEELTLIQKKLYEGDRSKLRDQPEGEELLLRILHQTADAVKAGLSQDILSAISQNQQRSPYWVEPSPLTELVNGVLPKYQPKIDTTSVFKPNQHSILHDLERAINQLEETDGRGGKYTALPTIDKAIGPALKILAAQMHDGAVAVSPRTRELLAMLQR